MSDMKKISDTSSRYYRIAIAAGVAEGVATNLRDQLREFKSYWRGARDLEAFRQQQQ